MYRFGQFGTKNLETWRDSLGTSNQSAETAKLDNALLQRWVAFRENKIPWKEFRAVLTATHNASVVSSSESPDECDQGLCYPYHGGSDPANPTLLFPEYTPNDDTFSIPKGVISVPFSMNVKQSAQDMRDFSGRINSSQALHYAGNPSVQLRFTEDPAVVSAQCAQESDCVAFLESFQAIAAVGGRYAPDTDDVNCSKGWPNGSGLKASFPWLVPGFRSGTEQDLTGAFYHVECRDKTIPFAGDEPHSASLSGANPIPDGAARVRTLSLIDGALVSETIIFILFEERFASYLGDSEDDFTTYGYMILERTIDLNDPDLIDEENYAGNVINEDDIEPINQDVLTVECSEDVLSAILEGSPSVTPENSGLIVRRLLGGAADDTTVPTIQPIVERVHYYCESTGNFDQGPLGNHPCPADGKLVRYFTVDPSKISDTDIRNAACQSADPFISAEDSSDDTLETPLVDENSRGSCDTTLNNWINNPTSGLIQIDPVWKCKDSNAVLCDDNRYNLAGVRDFYQEAPEGSVKPLLPITAEIDQAFRYKTQFTSRTGDNVGFAPEICIPNSSAKPYCYDPVQIEVIQDRTECLLYLWQAHRTDMAPADRSKLISYLQHAFSYLEIDHHLCETDTSPCPNAEKIPLPSTIEDGFEHNLAELMIMMGDESKTRAASSRFDLSDGKAAVFEGSQFEPGGPNLSSTAGYEMYSLYQAAQYYRQVLNRFYSFAPVVAESVKAAETGQSFITPDTVTWYVKKVVRASTALSDTWSQIANRYGALNELDLARRVIERAYTSTYLESVVMNRMMLNVIEVSDPASQSQINSAVEDAQRRYARSMRLMQQTYEALNSERSFYGISPDLVPIPQSQGFADSPFEVLYARLESQLSLAKLREDTAIASSREYEVDEAAFATELANIRNTYENQLVDICGTLVSDQDGQIYPATKKYAHLNTKARLFGDPCGQMGTGEIHEATIALELEGTNLSKERAALEAVLQKLEVERTRISTLCDLYFDWADYTYEIDEQKFELQQELNRIQRSVQWADRIQGWLSTTAGLAKCTKGLSFDCDTAAISSGAFAVGTAITSAVIAGLDIATDVREAQLAKLDRDFAKWNATGPCDIAQIDSDARVAEMLIDLKVQDLELLKAIKSIALRSSTLEQLNNKAKRLLAQQLEAEELAINAAAAKTDPNVRILKNDSITNAEIAFEKAMQAAYRLTLVYEYYTSMSYANAEDLYLIRMVSHGQPNLENYALELQNAYFEFEQNFGIGEQRLLVVSLMDDIIQVPRLDKDGAPLSSAERLKRYRNELTSLANRNEDGWAVFGFDTGLGSTSPISRVHKISHIQANIEAYREGDQMAVVYLRQKGTSTIYGLSGEQKFYKIPERTAVVHAKQNADGLSFAGPDLYISRHLQGRPLINNAWQLIINDQNEPWNLDDRVDEWGDIKLYIHYTDFTDF